MRGIHVTGSGKATKRCRCVPIVRFFLHHKSFILSLLLFCILFLSLRSNSIANEALLSSTNSSDDTESVVVLEDPDSRLSTLQELLGNITSITDAKNRVTEFIYDDLGRMVEVEDPAGRSTTYDYDEAGNVIRKIDRMGRKTEYIYDVLNRLRQVDYIGTDDQIVDSEIYTYDRYGALESVHNNAVKYTYTYNEYFQLTNKTDSRPDMNDKTLDYFYNMEGKRKQLVEWKKNYYGEKTHFLYDSTNRLTAMHNKDYLQANYHYDGAGRLRNRTLSNGARSQYEHVGGHLDTVVQRSAHDKHYVQDVYKYDPVGNITNIEHENFNTPSSNAEMKYSYNNDMTLDKAEECEGGVCNQINLDTEYDAVGNIERMASNAPGQQTRRFKYDNADKMNRLEKVQNDAGVTLYELQYDNEGNLTHKYDAGGNLVMKLEYDHKNRVTEAWVQGKGWEHYEYDPYDYRISKTKNGVTTHYYLEGEHIEAVYEQGAAPGQEKLKAAFLRGVVVDEILCTRFYDTAGRETYAV